MAIFQLFFQSREQVVVWRGQIRRIGWVIKTLEAPAGKFLLGCKCPVSRGIVVQEQDPLGDLPAAFYPSKYPSIAAAEISNTPRWQFGHLEDNQWGGSRLDPKKIKRELFQWIFALGFFWGRGESLRRHSIGNCCFVSGSQWYNRVSSMVTNSDRKSFGSSRKNSKSWSDDWHRWRFWSAFRHFGTHFAESSPMSVSSWMMDPTSSREMPSCSAIDLAEIRPAVFQNIITDGKISTFKPGHPIFYGGIRWCMFP